MSLKTVVRPYGGTPAIFVNDQPVTGLMHWNRNMESMDAANFFSQGIKLFSFFGNIDMGDGTLANDGMGSNLPPTMTPEHIDSVMEMILKGAPEALVIPRFRMQASEEWKRKHPGSQMRFYNLVKQEYEDGQMATPGCECWIEESLAKLAEIVEYCEKKWGDHIAGYHSGYGCCAEHVWYWGAKIADYNPMMVAQFRKMLRNYYKNESELRDAWHSDSVTFDTAEIPAPKQILALTEQMTCALLDPEHDQPVIDMLRAFSEYMAKLVVRQAQCVKQKLAELNSEKIFGAFYGYANLPANSYSHFAGGQDAHGIVLNCKELDFLSAPVGYSARQPGGVSTGQNLPGSTTINGKLYFAEDDTGTILTDNDHNMMPVTVEQCHSMMTRGFMDVWRNGGTQWFMDLWGEGEFRHPELMTHIGKLAAFAEKHKENRQSQAQIAVFLSDTALHYSKVFTRITGNLIEQQLNELAALGTAFDIFRIEDLPELIRQNRLGQYKMAIMLNLHFVSEELRSMIDEYLKKDNRTILWFHAAGVIRNGKFDENGFESLTGIHGSMLTYGRNSLLTEVLLNGKRFSYGTPGNATPFIYAADPAAETLGYLIEGTHAPFRKGSDDGTLVRKSFREWTSIWSLSPNMPSGLIAGFAENAGVHLYSRRGDQVFNTEKWIAVHSKWNGPLELQFPKKVSCKEAFSGKKIFENLDHFTLNVKRGENIVLEYC